MELHHRKEWHTIVLQRNYNYTTADESEWDRVHIASRNRADGELESKISHGDVCRSDNWFGVQKMGYTKKKSYLTNLGIDLSA